MQTPAHYRGGSLYEENKEFPEGFREAARYY